MNEEMVTQPIVESVGEHFAVGSLCADFIPMYQRWYNHFAVTRTLSTPIHPHRSAATGPV